MHAGEPQGPTLQDSLMFACLCFCWSQPEMLAFAVQLRISRIFLEDWVVSNSKRSLAEMTGETSEFWHKLGCGVIETVQSMKMGGARP